MITLEEKKFFFDIATCIDSITDHLENNMDFDVYLRSKTKRRAVERELEIIGEAVSKLLKINPILRISYARQIVDLRNKIIHAYDSVNNIVIWKIVIKDLPVLKQEVAYYLNHE